MKGKARLGPNWAWRDLYVGFASECGGSGRGWPWGRPVGGGNDNKSDNSNTKDGVVAQMWK